MSISTGCICLSVLTELDPVGLIETICVVTWGCGFWFCKSKGLWNGGGVMVFIISGVSGCFLRRCEFWACFGVMMS